jgi:uncharacterized protein
VLVGLYLGIDPTVIMQNVQQTTGGDSGPAVEHIENPAEAELREFISVVLADTEVTWTELFAAAGARYQEPTLVLFTDAVQSGCGTAPSSVGPFYCPADRKVYLDLTFFDELHRRFGAPGDFAQAYVVAHEVGHHVQMLMGISEQVRRLLSETSPAEANELSVRMELQADCFAGIWGHHANRSRHLLEQGDIEEGLAAAAAVGDDRLQGQSRAQVSPESFTHGTSAQRQRWFETGMRTGSIDACDTFAARTL